MSIDTDAQPEAIVSKETVQRVDEVCGYGAKVKQAQCLLALDLKEKHNGPGLKYYRERVGAPVPRAKAVKLFPMYFKDTAKEYETATEADLDALILLGQVNKERAYEIYQEYEGYLGINILSIWDKVQEFKKRAPRGDTLARQVANVLQEAMTEADRRQIEAAYDAIEEVIKNLRKIPAIDKEMKKYERTIPNRE